MNILNVKVLAGLSIALLLSLAGNAYQQKYIWQHHATEVQKAKDAAQIQALTGENEGFRRTQAVENALAKRATEDHTALMAQLEAIAERGGRFETRWRTAPGLCQGGPDQVAARKARQDAANTLFGPAKADVDPTATKDAR